MSNIDEILTAFYKRTLRVDGNTPDARAEASRAIQQLLSEAYKKGFIDGGINEITNDQQ